MADLAILVPVLGRPHRVTPLLASITAATPQPHRVLFICDRDDDGERAAVDRAHAEALLVSGGYARKINRALHRTDEPLVFFAADDLRFHPGWLDAATARLEGPIGVVGTNDLIRRRRVHATHFLVTREYAEQGAIDSPGPLCEDYDHSFVDDEFIATARHREAYDYAPDAVVEHLHWMNKTAPDDDIYRRGRARFRQDRNIFRRRALLWT